MGRLLLRIAGLCCVALSLLLIRLIHQQYIFENTLNTLLITFSSFTPSYSTALKSSTARHETLYYDFAHNLSDTNPIHIPPIIHYIWYHDLYPPRPNSLHTPSSGSDTPALCRKYNPNFTINIWNASAGRALVESAYPHILSLYDSYAHPIQRVDALKYILLHHYGGIYLDLDVSCRRALDALLEFPAWFPRASPLGVNNDVMAARTGHPLLQRMIGRLEGRHWNLGSPWLTIFWSTGPRFVSDVLLEWLALRRGNEASAESVGPGGNATAYDPDAFYVLPASFYSEQYTFFGHRPGGSWYGWDVAIIQWCLARPYVFLLPFCASLLAVVWSRRRAGRDHKDKRLRLSV